MDEKITRKRGWIVCGAVALVGAVLAGVLLLGNTVQAASPSVTDEQGTILPITTLSTVQDESMTENESDVIGGSSDIRLNDIRARWNNGKWEYSSDGGETWTDEAPEGFKAGEDGSLSVRQGEGSSEDFDAEAWEQELDGWLASIYEEVDNLMSDVMPEGYEDWSSFVRFGDTVARQTEDGQWEYSADNGETWTDEAPEGFSVNEDGTRFSIGGDGEDLDNFDFESFWHSLWPEHYSDTSVNKTVSV